jgi:nucleoside-diphosphate-sugar epimerase
MGGGKKGPKIWEQEEMAHRQARSKAEAEERRRQLAASSGILQTAFNLGTLINPRDRAGGMSRSFR